MAKTPSSRLFDLIKSLSSSERRYFTLAIGKDSDSKYLRLFNAIEQQAVFDDVVLKNMVYDGETVQGKKYSELKAYLYNLVLRYLQQFDEQSSVDYQLKNMLLNVRSLFRRLLYKDCNYLLSRVKKIALRYENFAILLEVLHWKNTLAYARSDVDYFDQNLQEIQKEEEGYLAQMAQIKIYEGLFYKLFLIARTNTPQSRELQEKVDRLSSHPLLLNESVPKSFKAKILFFRIRAILSYQRRELEDFYSQSKQLIPLMESKPFFLKEDVAHYISALNNLIGSCGFTSRNDEVRFYLEKLKRIKPKTKDDELKIHRQYYANYFRLCISMGEFEEGGIILEKHLKEVKKLDALLFERNVFYFQYFYIYFGNQNYDQALIYLNRWLNLPQSAEQKGLQVLARVLNLIIHYEIGNTIFLESLLKSTHRKLQKSEDYNVLEHLLFNCLRKANQTIDKKEKEVLFTQTAEQLKTMSWSQTEKAIFRLFDFEAWFLSKAQNNTFAAIIKATSKR